MKLMNTCLVSSITLFKNCEMYFYDIVGYPQQQPPNVPQASYPPPGSYPPQQQPTVPANVENFAPPPDYSVGKFSVQTVLLGRLPKVDLIVRGKCPYVRPSTKSFFDLNEIWCIGRGR